MAAGLPPVQIHGAQAVYGAKMQQHSVLNKALGQGKNTPVVQVLPGPLAAPYAGKLTFRRKGHQNGFVISGGLGGGFHREGPLAVQIEVAAAAQLRAGIFRENVLFIQILSPDGQHGGGSSFRYSFGGGMR